MPLHEKSVIASFAKCGLEAKVVIRAFLKRKDKIERHGKEGRSELTKGKENVNLSLNLINSELRQKTLRKQRCGSNILNLGTRRKYVVCFTLLAGWTLTLFRTLWTR
jgi:hypothetical protein